MSEVIETIVDSEIFSEDSPCATGACPVLELTEIEPVEETVSRGDLVIFNLRGKVRPGKVISKGKVSLGIDTIGLQTNTKIPAATEFVPVVVFVEKAVLDSLAVELEAA